jgi:hypothetical protein
MGTDNDNTADNGITEVSVNEVESMSMSMVTACPTSSA